MHAGVKRVEGHLEWLDGRQAVALLQPPLPRQDAVAALVAAGITDAEAVIDWYSSWSGHTDRVQVAAGAENMRTRR